ncbi:MAG: 2OG-Fe(II) oxygenase [Deltaproteobacteria bacterium]|nr:2OG-Fe(II) oxygenase [Kofleriaceae bacterium]
MQSPLRSADLLRDTTIENLSKNWRAAAPFPHVVIDDVIPPDALGSLMAMLDEEPVDPYEGDLFTFDASAPEPRTDELRAARDDLAATLAPVLSRVTGKAVTRADLRAFAYREGHYLLPHSDHQQGLGRALAYAYYLPSPEPPVGGELELYRCTIVAGEIVATESALLVEPRPNRLVVFDVSDVSLHQVREVVRGLRLSLAGWFYP